MGANIDNHTNESTVSLDIIIQGAGAVIDGNFGLIIDTITTSSITAVTVNIVPPNGWTLALDTPAPGAAWTVDANGINSIDVSVPASNGDSNSITIAGNVTNATGSLPITDPTFTVKKLRPPQ